MFSVVEPEPLWWPRCSQTYVAIPGETRAPTSISGKVVPRCQGSTVTLSTVDVVAPGESRYRFKYHGDPSRGRTL